MRKLKMRDERMRTEYLDLNGATPEDLQEIADCLTRIARQYMANESKAMYCSGLLLASEFMESIKQQIEKEKNGSQHK